MLKKLTATVFAFALLLSGSSFALSQTSDDKIKAEVANRGTGENAKLTVTTKGGVQSKGYVTRAGADSFDLRIQNSTETQTFSYADVSKVKKPGWSKAAKIGLGVAIGLGAAVAVFAIALKNADIFPKTFPIGPTTP